jgi:hypothetical protein
VAGLAAAALLTPAPSAQAFGGPVEISAVGAASSGAAITGRTAGGASVAWRQASDGAVLLRSVSLGGVLGTPVTVASESRPRPPAIAQVPGGSIVTWVRSSDDHLLARRVADDGALGPIHDISGTSLSFANGIPTVAANASGKVAVVWRRANDSHVRIRLFDAQSGPSAPDVDLTAEPDIALWGTNVSVAINDAGESVVVWHRNTDCHIIARRVTADGTAGAQVDLSGEPDSAIGDTTPTVAIRPDGTVVGAWHRDSDHHAVSRRWMADGSFGPVVDLSLSDGVPSMANMAITPLATGDAVAWQRESDSHMVTATGSGSAPPAPVDVSLAAGASVTPPSIATTVDGALGIAWVGADGTARVAFSTAVPGPAPSSTPTPSPTPTPTPTPDAPASPAPASPSGTPLPRSDEAPDTQLVGAAPIRLRAGRTATVRFRSSVAGSRFICSLDRAAAKPCRSPLRLRGLRPGRHTLRVWAVSRAGKDRSPLTLQLRVTRR